MSEPFSKTALYDDWPALPPLVEAAVELSRERDFIFSCTPEQGELLALLARGRAGGRIGETGTGCGVGLAWMASAVGPDTQLISIEIDKGRAAASKALFESLANVTLLQGDWRGIISHGPFDLLVLDGGGGGKRENDPPADPSALLVPGGSVVLDDFHPPMAGWPPAVRSAADEYGLDCDRARDYWFNHSDLLTTEFRLHPEVSAVIGTRKGGASG